MTDQNPIEAPVELQETTSEVEQQPQEQNPPEQPQETAQGSEETFPRAYVEQLRREAAEARVKAKRADELEQALFVARVAATGRLADPKDLAFDAALVNDQEALGKAIDQLLADHPHYAARRPRGDAGQGASGEAGAISLADLLRVGAH